jgi:hypothetical protein
MRRTFDTLHYMGWIVAFNAVYSVLKQKLWSTEEFWNKTFEKRLSQLMILMTFQTVCLISFR